MKKITSFMLILVVVLGLFPKTVAAESNVEGQIKQYLREVCNTRGLTVTKEDLDYSLSFAKLNINDLETVTELKDTLGEVIKSDGSNLHAIYKQYNLNRTSLNDLLSANGETLNDYIYLDDLSTAVKFYCEDNAVQNTNFDSELVNYLTQVSKVRGIQVTEDDFNNLLAEYNVSIEDFNSMNACRDYVGNVIKSDLSNLTYFYEKYGLDKQSLCELLTRNGEDIDNFVYINQLDQYIRTYCDTPYPSSGNSVKHAKTDITNMATPSTPASKLMKKPVVTPAPSTAGKPHTTYKTVKGGSLPVTATNTASLAMDGFILMIGGSIILWIIKGKQNG